MMVAVRTPLRVSLFGGGTDYPAYFHREPGAVLGFTIDKYIYLSALRLTASVDYRYRLSYSLVDTGVKRHASAIVAEQVKNTAQGAIDSELREMLGLVDAAQQILEDAGRRDDAPSRIGDLLHQSWQLKKRLSSQVTGPEINDL